MTRHLLLLAVLASAADARPPDEAQKPAGDSAKPAAERG